MNDHPNKHIRAAVDYALQRGWRVPEDHAARIRRVVDQCQHVQLDKE